MCTSCDGTGCEECDGGYFTVAGCTADFVGDMWEVINTADLFYKGLAPDPGGVLDQCQWFIEASGYYKQEQGRAKADEQEKHK